ncbi:sugar transferase [Chloroflexota bacterium]
MAKFRLLLIVMAVWFIILFNIERPDFVYFGNIDLDSVVYVIAALAALTILVFPDLGKRVELMLLPALGFYVLGKLAFGRAETFSMPLVVTEILVIIITIVIARMVTLAASNIEQAIENVLLKPARSNVLPEIEGEEKINNELFRARRFDRPVGFILLRLDLLDGMTEQFTDKFNMEESFRRHYVKVRIAQIAESTIYRSDVVAWSRNDLVLCLPETDMQQTLNHARKLHFLIQTRMGLSVTIGVSVFSEDGLIYRDLLDAALLNPINVDGDDSGVSPVEPKLTVAEAPVIWKEKSQSPVQVSKPVAFRRFFQRVMSVGDVTNIVPDDFIWQRLDNPHDPGLWINDLPYQSASSRTVYRVIKRTIDLALIILTIPLTLPMFGLVTLSVFLDSGRPIFFVQQRTGLGGHRFGMYKFRTMVPNAEEKLQELADQGIAKLDENGKLAEPLKLKRDPRVTRVGRILRKTSLDEIPQLLNVLRGDMSLVGPRPTSWGLGNYTLLHTERLTIRPGITGLWQISSRGNTDFDNWLEWDMLYIDKMSFALDFQIMLRTFTQVLKRRGAH